VVVLRAVDEYDGGKGGVERFATGVDKGRMAINLDLHAI
jgi:hypothetical protein